MTDQKKVLKARYKLVEPLHHELSIRGMNVDTGAILQLLENNHDNIQACVDYMVELNGQTYIYIKPPGGLKGCFQFYRDWWCPRNEQERNDEVKQPKQFEASPSLTTMNRDRNSDDEVPLQEVIGQPILGITEKA